VLSDPQWWAHPAGALRVHPHKHYANYSPQKDRGCARGGCGVSERCGVFITYPAGNQ
jgi:hypothetical protein